MIRLLLISCLLLLSACASRAPLPAQMPTLNLPQQLHIQRLQAGERQDWMLVIQREQANLRWSLLDFLGIPQARQLLSDGTWQADGLLPPNPQARELFAAVLFALTPEAELAGNYPGARQQGQRRTLGERWQVIYEQPETFTVKLAQGLRYNVSPLPTEATP
ncbi:DUF3261 domain-containing protein [Pseudomonas sp. R5(2019)]|uniref:DUF3261 domain-containing protein n=1 Tax=Pseudomonas sp. R5(2019) TaxID=2697566 RepID=UPI001412CE73|nr:DUF3261 domain-containing protein [Pseudomonas sp. R5(2019)]NBA94009.1 hypothetical protein [Pseudomonas sp. R5(2019)]